MLCQPISFALEMSVFQNSIVDAVGSQFRVPELCWCWGRILRVGSGLRIVVRGCYSCYRWTSKLFLLDPLDISQFAIFILHIAKCTVCNIHCAVCILVAALCAFWPPGFHSQIPGESNTSVVEMQQQKFCKQQTSAVIHTSTSTSQVHIQGIV